MAEVHRLAAVPSCEARFTVTPVVIVELHTTECPDWVTWLLHLALVYVTFTLQTDESRRTDAFKAADLVHACTVVMAGASVTVLLVMLTQLASGAPRTRALEVGYQVVTSATIGTGITGTVIDVDFTVGPHKADRTGTLIVAHVILAHAVVLTWCRRTVVDIHLAVAALITRATYTQVTVVQVCTCTSILTKL